MMKRRRYTIRTGFQQGQDLAPFVGVLLVIVFLVWIVTEIARLLGVG